MKKVLIIILLIFLITSVSLSLRQNYIQGKKITTLTNSVDDKNKEIKNLNTRIYELSLEKLKQNNISSNNIFNDLIPTPEESSPIETFQAKMDKSCQEDQTRYTSCLTEYNTKMIEYQSCQTCEANHGFGCGLSCIEPHNMCSKYKPSSLCQ